MSGGIAAANCIAAYQPKGAASYAASLTNLANPGTYTAAEGVTPTWDTVNGWGGDGSSKYLILGNPVLGQSCTIMARFSMAAYPAAYKDILGRTQTYSQLLAPNSVSLTKVRNIDGQVTTSAALSGVWSILGLQAYLNTTLAATFSVNANVISINFYALASNIFPTGASGFFPGAVQAIAIYDTVITAAQHAAVVTAMLAL